MSASLLLSACADEETGDEKRVDFTPLERQSKMTRPVVDPAPPVDLEEHPEYRQIIRGFRNNAAALFEREDIGERIQQIERVFVGTGKYLELLAIYQEVVEKQGLVSAAAPRLAWSYIRLGQRRQARELIDRLLEARPKDAVVAFLDGSWWFNEVRESEKAAARAAIAWRRALDLDPDFQGFAQINAPALEQKVRQLEARLSKPPEELIGGEAPAEPPQVEEAEPKSETSASAEGEAAGEGVEEAAETLAEGAAETVEEPVREESAPSDRSGANGGERPIPILLTRADLALNAGRLGEAKGLYERVLEADPERLEAEFGLIRVLYKENPHASEAHERAEKLVGRPRLGADLAYDLGLFARAKLERPELADKFFDVVRSKDPSMAEKLGIGE